MPIPPPRNGYFYTERERLLQEEDRRWRWQNFCILMSTVFLLAGGVPGIVAAIGALIANVVYGWISTVLYALFGVNWNDQRAMLRINWLALACGGVFCLGAGALHAVPVFALFGLVLWLVGRWITKPSRRQMQDWAVQEQPVPRIRE